MRIKKFIALLMLIVVFQLLILTESSAQQYNQRITNNKTNEEILIGKCTRKAFYEAPFESWFRQEYSLYSNVLDKKTCDSIQPLLKDVRITIVLGTWCSDSRQHVPDFFAVADYLHIPDSNITLICVDRDKQAVSFSIEDLKITLIPTFLIYRNNTEIGRIIETPSKSIEKDLFAILKSP